MIIQSVYGDECNVYTQPKLRESPSLIRRSVADFWTHEIPLTPVTERKQFLINHSAQKSVLHVGCVDWPVFNPDDNLHLSLSKTAASLDCLDPDLKGLEELKKYFPGGSYYSNANQIDREYHLVIVPEVIEHVNNIQLFLASLNQISFNEIIITGPYPKQSHFIRHSATQYTELVHPDHKIWVTPYTLVNMVEQYTGWELTNVYLWENAPSCGVRFIKPTTVSSEWIQELHERIQHNRK